MYQLHKNVVPQRCWNICRGFDSCHLDPIHRPATSVGASQVWPDSSHHTTHLFYRTQCIPDRSRIHYSKSVRVCTMCLGANGTPEHPSTPSLLKNVKFKSHWRRLDANHAGAGWRGKRQRAKRTRERVISSVCEGNPRKAIYTSSSGNECQL